MSRAIQHLEIEENWSTLAGPLPPFPPNLRWSGCRGSGEPKIRSITASRNLRNWLKMLKETLSYEARLVIRSHKSPMVMVQERHFLGHVQTPATQATQAMEEQLQLLRPRHAPGTGKSDAARKIPFEVPPANSGP